MNFLVATSLMKTKIKVIGVATGWALTEMTEQTTLPWLEAPTHKK